MTTLTSIEWSDPILPSRPDPVWIAEVKRRGGRVFEVDHRIAPSPWVRELGFVATTYQPARMPRRLFQICLLVTAQENSCRYCYGANRAYMKILGYSEAFISRLERDAQLAELNDAERACISFFRSLARSRPRPSQDAARRLVGMGYSESAVAEMAFTVAIACLYNRISTLIACPPEAEFERMADGFVGRLMGLAMPVLQKLGRGNRAAVSGSAAGDDPAGAPFRSVIAPLAGLPAHKAMRSMLDGALGDGPLGREIRALMFAVVARTVGSRICETESRRLLAEQGLGDAEVETALMTLQWRGLPATHAGLLAWARDTVFYETGAIQRATRELGARIGDAALLDAIGVVALANATVRLAMLAE